MKPRNGSTTVRTSSQMMPATESPIEIPMAVKSATMAAKKPTTIQRSRRIEEAHRAGGLPTIILVIQTWWM